MFLILRSIQYRLPWTFWYAAAFPSEWAGARNLSRFVSALDQVMASPSRT